MALLGALFLLAACADDSPDPAPEAAPVVDVETDGESSRRVEVKGATFVYAAAPTAGVASHVEALEEDSGRDVLGVLSGSGLERPDREVPLAFALRSCIDLGGGLFAHEIQWRPPEGVALPVTATVWAGAPNPWLRDSSPRYFEVELSQPGLFTLVTDVGAELTLDPGDDGIGVSAERLARVDHCELRVPSEVYIDDQGEVGLRYEAGDTLGSVDAPPGTVQARAGGEDQLAVLLRELLLRLGPDTDLLPDRWWLAGDATPASLHLQRRYGCWTVSSTWDDPAVTVTQERGCDDSTYRRSEERLVEIEDPAWRVRVSGRPAEVDAFVEQVRSFPVAGVDKVTVDGLTHEAIAAYEARLADQGVPELGRLPWNDDGVIIVSRAESGAHFEVAGFAPEQLGDGVHGTPVQRGICVATMSSSSTEGGFSIVVVEDDSVATIEREREPGVWEQLELVVFPEIRLGLLDDDLRQVEPNLFSVPPPAIRGFDATGAPLDCVRN